MKIQYVKGKIFGYVRNWNRQRVLALFKGIKDSSYGPVNGA